METDLDVSKPIRMYRRNYLFLLLNSIIIGIRNNLIQKLANTLWRADAQTQRSLTHSLTYSVA